MEKWVFGWHVFTYDQYDVWERNGVSRSKRDFERKNMVKKKRKILVR